MCKEVTNQAVAVTLIHGEAAFRTRSENALRQSLGKPGNIFLVGRCQINHASEMGHNGIKSRDIVEPELPKCTLQNLNPAFFACLLSSSRINGLHDFINLR